MPYGAAMVFRRFVLFAALASSQICVASAHAKTAPIPIPDMGIEAVGAGPGNTGRLAISVFEYRGPTKAPQFLPLELWTIAAGRRRPARRPFTRAKINEGRLTFVPGGSLLAHSETTTTAGKRGWRVFMAELSSRGTVRSDTPISDPAEGGAAAKGAPLVGRDGTIAQRYGAAAGDVTVPEWLVLRPNGQAAWTSPSPLPVGEYRRDVRLGPDGSGAVISTPLDTKDNALLLSRFGRDGQLAPPVRVELATVRADAEPRPLDVAAAITDSGTLVVTLSVPSPDGAPATSHLLLITLPAGAAAATAQDVGPAASATGDQGTLDVETAGGDTATVLVGGTPHTLRVFDSEIASSATWSPSSIPARTGYDGGLVRLHRGGLAAIWAASGKRGALFGTRRPAGSRLFASPKRLSSSKWARGNVELIDTALLANDKVFVAYERYGTRSEGDGAFAFIARP